LNCLKGGNRLRRAKREREKSKKKSFEIMKSGLIEGRSRKRGGVVSGDELIENKKGGMRREISRSSTKSKATKWPGKTTNYSQREKEVIAKAKNRGPKGPAIAIAKKGKQGMTRKPYKNKKVGCKLGP